MDFGFFKIQPSEIMRPALFIVTAWLIPEKKIWQNIPGVFFACFCVSLTIILLFLQPDLGLALLIFSVL